MVKVKICGITREEDLKAAVEVGADSVGFVIGVPSSPRNITLSKAVKLIATVPKRIDSVAVTVFKSVEECVRIKNDLEADFLQVHGDLHRLLESIIGQSFEKCIVGAINAKMENAYGLAVEYSNYFNSILLDTAEDDGSGGTGIPHNWSLSRKIRDTIYPRPLILAGGLTHENVGKAIRKVKPFGVDVSSGVEEKLGIKDREKMFDFVANAKEADL